MNVLLISDPFPCVGGGGRRSFEVLKRICKYFEDHEVIFSLDGMYDFIQTIRSNLEKNYIDELIHTLNKHNININQYSIELLKNLQENFKIKNIDVKSFLKLSFPNMTYPPKINTYSKLLLESIKMNNKNFDIIYSHHEGLDKIMLGYNIAKKLDKRFVVLLQLEPFKHMRMILKFKDLRNLRELVNIIPEYNVTTYTKKIYTKIAVYTNFLSVSIAPLIPVIKFINEPIKYKILKPANAFESKLLKYRRNLKKKENYAVFFARFTPEKGIFELPIIWRIVTKKIPDIKLIVCGRQDQRFLGKFKNLAKKYNVEDKIILKGYVPRDELFEIVSKAKVFVYPTHSDAFPLVTLESLAVGTPVVAYDIPAIKYTYRDINAVKIVREWNTKEMAKRVIDILKISEDEYIEMLNERKLINFLKLHSSWENVAKNEAKELENLLNFKEL